MGFLPKMPTLSKFCRALLRGSCGELTEPELQSVTISTQVPDPDIAPADNVWALHGRGINHFR
jgi:hypothetical protein